MAVFIDRQLAGPWGRDGHRYTHEPFEEPLRRNSAIRAQSHAAADLPAGLKQLAGFDGLRRPTGRTLKQIENAVFFDVLRRNTIEGMFCDPQHGGNVDMVGWQLIGFPGPRMSNYAEMDITGRGLRPSR